ncbi:hypothetical protein U8P73_36110 (plasmid) [Rhizobium beringeri]|uniref:hypothetical protein n=1 Tax=Rhizobium beringeri TaxID=3019934 RepID=UPI002DDD0293|nr:hypothetical protein [Rhizobium beringeri]WSG93575.1 hypothetical protein U8P73_36110 [Rhizobium beringeri]
MNLYFINGSDNNGDSMDLFVRAESPQEAFDAWKANDICIGWECCFEGVLSSEPAGDAGVEDLRFFLVPESNVAGAVNWHTPDGVNCVAFAVPKDEAGVPDEDENKCRDCGEEYADGGDGYNGRCPDCADKAEEEGRSDD